MRIHCLKHVPFEGPGAIAEWAAARGHAIATVEVHADEALPAPADSDLLVVMGGPMNIYQDSLFPWLAAEKARIGEILSAGVPAVGVCLGAQLLADALGARVVAGEQKEIGWFPVEAMPGAGAFAGLLPEQLTVFHWHGDTFPLPQDAQLLASSAACGQQAFDWQGRVLGLQCHLESTPESVRLLAENCADELVPGPFIQSAERMLAEPPGTYERMHAVLFKLLDRLVEQRPEARG